MKPLTPRQSQVLRLIAEDVPDKQIASRLGVSDKTVAYHWAKVKQTLGLQTRIQGVHYAIARGLTPLMFCVALLAHAAPLAPKSLLMPQSPTLPMLLTPPPPPLTVPVKLQWDASPDATVTGYLVYWGATQANYTFKTNVGKVLTAAVTVPRGTYHFAATAYDASGSESDFSNDAEYQERPSLNIQPVQFDVGFTPAPGKTNVLQFSTNLVNWSAVATTTATNRFTLRVNNFGGANYYRVQVK